VQVVSRIYIALALVLLSATTLTAAGIVNVIQKDRMFNIANAQISRGEVVRFINSDPFMHQLYVEAPSFSFQSDEQKPNTNVDIQFSTAGLFEVRCYIHPKMVLRIEVH
jgi:plastocyanin